MTAHLRRGDFVDALDQALDASRQAHLIGCRACQEELASLQSVVSEATRVDAAAPSPLFWDHFSERVRQATSADAVPSSSTWWRGWWRAVGALAGAIGAVALVAVLRPAWSVPTVLPVAEDGRAVHTVVAADDGSWGLVIGLASELDWIDVREAAKPADGTADAMIEELTPAQRDALVRLLQKEMGEQ